MRQILIAVFASVLFSVGTVFTVYNFAPLSLLQPESQRVFGAAVTTIQGTDTLSSSRTTINNNFSALNTAKFELSDWYATTSAAQLTSLANLSTIGTIVSGTWHGTTLGVPYGGTGSTTLSSNQVLLGNGASAFGIVAGYGTSGQFLTSNGNAVAPSWQSASVDQSLNYNWTGTNRFKNLNASSTAANPLVLNGLSFDTPSTRAASSTVLMEDGNGHLSFQPISLLLKQSVTQVVTQASATTTLATYTLPANTFTTGRVLSINAQFGETGGCDHSISFGNGSSSSTIAYVSVPNVVAGASLNVTMYATSTTAQVSQSRGTYVNASQYSAFPFTAPVAERIGNIATTFNLAAQTYISFNSNDTTGSINCILQAYSVALQTP